METSRRKTGSAMSDRQMARAAAEGRRITFIQELAPSYTEDGRSLAGYLVGMDDYHWMIVPEVYPAPDQDLPVVLVHKSCPFVMISSSTRLSDQPEPYQRLAKKIGERFWDHCKQAYLGHTATPAQEEQ